MAVYIINNMRIHDRTEYDTSLRAFMRACLGVVRQFNGEVLAALEAPTPIEGEWPFDRTILPRFPSREEALGGSEPPQYQAIVAHRFNGTTSNVVCLDGHTCKRLATRTSKAGA